MVVETRLDGRWSGRRGFIPGSARGLVRLTEVRPAERTQRIGQRPTLKLRPDAREAFAFEGCGDLAKVTARTAFGELTCPLPDPSI